VIGLLSPAAINLKIKKCLLCTLIVTILCVDILQAQCNPPVLSSNLNLSVCSQNVIQIQLFGDPAYPAANSFNILTKVVQDGLIEWESNPTIPANGVSENYLSGSGFVNQTAEPLMVIYSVQPIGIDGCLGLIKEVKHTIYPEPVIFASDFSVCNGDSIGLILDSNLIGVTYQLLETVPVGIQRGDENISFFASFQDPRFLEKNRYTNITDTLLKVQLSLSYISGIGCIGSKSVLITIYPTASLNTELGSPSCSGTPIDLILQTNNNYPDILFEIQNVEFDAGIMAIESNAEVPASSVSSDYLRNDMYINTTPNELSVSYYVIPFFNGCFEQSMTVSRVEVIIKPVPPKPSITVSNLNSSSPLLTSSSALGNQWFLNGLEITNATEETYSVDGPGSYTVQVRIDNCFSQLSDPKNLVVVGVEPLKQGLFNIEIYPNPTHAEIYIGLDKLDESSNYGVSVIDQTGKEVLKISSFGGTSIKLGLGHLMSGIYLIIVSNQTEVYFKRIFKQ
jgi:hypothetical protein